MCRYTPACEGDFSQRAGGCHGLLCYNYARLIYKLLVVEFLMRCIFKNIKSVFTMATTV